MIKVGDIVKTKSKAGTEVLPAVVTKVNNGSIDSVEVLFSDGTSGYRTIKKVSEIGRHIDMQSVLDSIQ